MTKYILLDIHGVLTDGKERKRFMSYMKKKYNMDKKKHNNLWMKNLKSLDKGKIKPKVYIKKINNEFGTKFSIKQYYGLFTKQIKVNRILLKKLKNRKVYILSDNFSSIVYGLNKILGKQFEQYRKIYSHKIGLTKSENLFKPALKILKLKPENCLFIDDSLTNVKIARKNKIKSILFKSNSQFSREFRKYKDY
jgi:HAD superfamily hydrolase (TIGR01509 family)